MNLRQMEYLLTIKETGNISRAAEKCYISQSGMSQQLSNIEKEIGAPLFLRMNNQLFPTREGDIYLRYAKEILGMHARAMKEIEDCRNPDRGRILIGVSPERGNAMLQQIFPVFQKDFPDIHFHIVENHLSELEQMVCNSQVDISESAYTPQVPSSLNDQVKHIDLYRERIMLIIPNTPYFQKKLEGLGAEEEGSVVDLRDFQDERFVIPTDTRIRLRSVVDWTFHTAEFTPNIVLETSNNLAALNFVSEGNYLSLIPQSYRYSIYGQTNQIYYRALKQDPYWIRSLIYRKQTKLTGAEKRLVRLIKDFHAPVIEKLGQDS